MYSNRTEFDESLKPTVTPIFIINKFEKFNFHSVEHPKMAILRGMGMFWKMFKCKPKGRSFSISFQSSL